MRSRALVIATLAVVGALALSGCSAGRAMPKGPTDAEVDAVVQTLLDRQWRATELEGKVERPLLDVVHTSGEWTGEMGECVSEMGLESYGWSDTEGFIVESGKRGTDAQQLAFYECFARFPAVVVLSTEQREFIYDYYARSLVPCLGLHGYAMSNLPKRDAFVAGTADAGVGWTWSPYSALRQPPTTQEAYAKIYRACPPTIPGIDGWSTDAG